MDNNFEQKTAERDYLEAAQDSSDHLRYQVEFAQKALNISAISNGGAIVSLLTFVGNNSRPVEGENIEYAFAAFIAGLVMCLVAHIAAISSQSNYHSYYRDAAWEAHGRLSGGVRKKVATKDLNWGNRAAFFGALILTLSTASFSCGSVFALRGLI